MAAIAALGQRSTAFERVVVRAQACRLCPRMEGRRRVLGSGNGALDARVLFVAEAPGRLGGDRTGVPLVSDQSGRNFTCLLQAAGWRRDEVFVTNAVLCNPRDGRGRNDTPAAREIRNCSPHLRDLLAILDPPYVVALGRTALAALALIAPHEAALRRDVGPRCRGRAAPSSRSTIQARAPSCTVPSYSSKRILSACAPW